RDVCLRDGVIRVFIIGRVDRVGTIYKLSAEIRDPHQDTILATVGQDAAGDGELMLAVRRLSTAVREKLGESHDTVRANEVQLEKVTSPSLTAVQLYTRARNSATRGMWESSAIFAREAVATDPGFASAHNWLGWSLMNVAKADQNEALRHFEQARQLSGGTT